MNSKKRFKGGGQRRQHFDRKVRPEGHSRVVAMGKVIPPDWRYVRMTIVSKSKNHVTVRIRKLLGENNLARTPKPNPKHRQNT